MRLFVLHGIILSIVLSIFLSACNGPTPSPVPPPEDEPLYLSLVWHQHQPLYYKNEQGVYTRPWARVHATKDYYDMASMVQEYPDVHVTFNLTPVLIRQLDDFAMNEAKDIYWVFAEVNAAELTEEEKRFILERFFDANWDNIIARFPRYKELLDKRGGAEPEQIEVALQSFTEQDFRDLQVWFNLAWFDPDFLDQEPLRGLVQKGRNFSEEDKEVLFNEARHVIKEVIPLHKRMQETGQIEIITTPYAHPILPLIYDTNLASIGNPSAELPDNRFSYPNDVISQLDKSVDVYEFYFDQKPTGLWPSEGAVAQDIVSVISKAGYKWMGTGEPVLAASLGIGSFTRDSDDTVQEADLLYRPYFVQGAQGDPVMIIFRDWILSDKIGFTYSQTPGKEAADDYMNRLENIRQRLKEEGTEDPHLVSVILDGENAWEFYPNDGKEFLNALYQNLSESETIKTVTPSEFLAMFPEQEYLEELFPGAWFSANYDTWIGEAEENKAWEYLREVREDLFDYDYLEKKSPPTPEDLESALENLYLAEGSDWFWWYGSDQNSGQDTYFDIGFRELLANVYRALEEPVPDFVKVPIIPQEPEEPSKQFGGFFVPTIDGVVNPSDEWAMAATYLATGGAMSRAEDIMAGFSYGMDSKTLYFMLDAKSEWSSFENLMVGFYVYSPRLTQNYPFTHATQGSEDSNLIGFGATNLFEVNIDNGVPSVSVFTANQDGWTGGEVLPEVSAEGSVLELAAPLSELGPVEPGDELRLLVVVSQEQRDLQNLPGTGPGQLIIPDLGLTSVVLELIDAEGDDNGSGDYIYPTDGVFEDQIFDLKAFIIGYDENNLVFKFTFYGPIPNPWGSPNNLSLQTLDVYVDKDPGKETGSRQFLPGRNAALTTGNGWEYAVWAEGWTPQFLTSEGEGVPKPVTTVDFNVIVDPASSTVTLRVPRDAFGEGDPETWGYAAAVLSQDGFPSPGVWRVRDGQELAAQWRFGGVPPETTNYPRIFDIPDLGDQASQLNYVPSSLDENMLTPEDYAQITPLIIGP